ncbi:hypothetical protein ZWY2020_054700 [Hordeum vulgare]|nr:hypothetical protein ZWY2020_054700 [Hordeum vulgare]
MSLSDLPTTTAATTAFPATLQQPPPPHHSPPAATSGPAASGPAALAAEPAPVLSPAEMSSMIRDLNLAVSNLRTFLQDLYATPPPPPPPAVPFAPPPPATFAPQGLPITQVRWPPSPSPLPTWIDTTTYTTAPLQLTVLQPPAPTFGGFGGYTDPYVGSSVVPQHSPSAALGRHEGTYAVSPHVQRPPRFTKLEFATYDGTVDPLNWLNQCDQFFRGQQTMASDRTWIASYHLRGAAQTWYDALEQDEGGMPPWERFRDLRLAKLGRLPFTTSVQDFADCFETLACHAPDITARQRAELFVGGLPDHIRIDVEMRDPQDLQTAMYYTRAYEQRANALQQAFPGRDTRPPTRPAGRRHAPRLRFAIALPPRRHAPSGA